MQSLADIKSALEIRGLRPSRALGQNFLIEPAHVTRLVDASGVAAGDLVLEVGPGTGVLTDVLLERGCKVVACELDRGLADLLRERYAAQASRGEFTLVEGDCLQGKHGINTALVEALGTTPFKLVANLPYNAASPLMILLATRAHPALARELAPCLGQYVTIQREVAERLRAGVGTRDYGEMGVLVQAMCEVRRIALLAPGCFWPPPKIESEMVAIVPRGVPATSDPERLARLCRTLFTQRRKQIGSILRSADPALLAALPPEILPMARPEALTVDQLVELSQRAT